MSGLASAGISQSTPSTRLKANPFTVARLLLEGSHHVPETASVLGRTQTVSYRLVDHTGELQLELEAPAREGLFEEAVVALGDVLAGDSGPEGAEEAREVRARADDDPTLLAAWLDELVFLAESEGLVPRRVERLDVGPREVTGLVSFVRGAPPHLVKGVTYHDLVFVCEEGTWRARAVLDV